MDSEVQPTQKETSFTGINGGLIKPEPGGWIDIFTGGIKEALLKMKKRSK